jgi:hypothetical protein
MDEIPNLKSQKLRMNYKNKTVYRSGSNYGVEKDTDRTLPLYKSLSKTANLYI